MRVEIPGVTVGHWTDMGARTGCTVVLLPPSTTASGEVRGGSPATREFELLDPTRFVSHVDAVVLSGGSAFGLAAADGVVAALEAQGRGYETSAANVPIVVAMSLYDLGVGDPNVRPGPAQGALALKDCCEDPETGRVGAGTGATVGKWRQPDEPPDGGIGMFTTRKGELVVTALVANNAAGDIDDGTVPTEIAQGAFADWPEVFGPDDLDPAAVAAAVSNTGATVGNTVIGVIVTNARLDPVGCRVVAEGAHDGLARAVFPPHTRSDGDAFVAAATGGTGADVDDVRALAVVATEQALRGSVTAANRDSTVGSDSTKSS